MSFTGQKCLQDEECEVASDLWTEEVMSCIMPPLNPTLHYTKLKDQSMLGEANLLILFLILCRVVIEFGFVCPSCTSTSIQVLPFVVVVLDVLTSFLGNVCIFCRQKRRLRKQ